MSRDDFELIAQAFAEAEQIVHTSEPALAALKIAAMRMSAHLAIWAHFEQAPFLDACFPITKVGSVDGAARRWAS